MSETDTVRLLLEQQGPYAFKVTFAGTTLEPLLTDEPPPLGAGAGPNPSELLLAGIANCLSASLLFALRKFKNQPGPLRTEISATPERNAEGRLRIPKARVTLQLADGQEAYQHLDRILAQFENFCVVTQSVRDGIDVEVTVLDAAGRVVGGDGSPATPS
ncbi:MAG: OsmC family protein [Gammaproteobacteria bacterium]|nr:OsmC family protein [Gammaproteobacteria bacterium]